MDKEIHKGERIAKKIARAGLCSRREAERWIEAGRVSVNGETLTTPACVVTDQDKIIVDGTLLPQAEKTKLFMYYKPSGFLTTNRDDQGRPTIFDNLPDNLPRVITVGRLDMNTEGLLLLTNDGALARHLELPSTGWIRRYRVRVYGHPDEKKLSKLKNGIEVEGVRYGSIEADIDKVTGDNTWINMALTEGKNREIRNVMEHLGLPVNRLIRLSYGPFQLGKMKKGDIREVSGKIIREQIPNFA